MDEPDAAAAATAPHQTSRTRTPAAPTASGSTAPTAAPQQSSRSRWLALGAAADMTSLGHELSGSLGDLGTFLPLVVALSASIQLDLGTTLALSGISNIVSGVSFRIPMCVQPMKTIAAVALASPGLSLPEVMAAGLFVGGVMLAAGATGAMDLVNRAVPGSIVRGIQLAVGLQLAQKGVTQVFQSSAAAQHSYRQLWGVDGCLLGILAAAFLLVTTLPEALAATGTAHHRQQQQQLHKAAAEQQGGESRQEQSTVQPADQQLCHQQQEYASSPRQQPLPAAQQQPGDSDCGGCSSSGSSSSGSVPSALIIVLLGLVLAVVASPGVLLQLRLGPSIPQLYLPTWGVFKDGVLKAGLAQLPLTSLNSVIAVSHLAGQLFPERAATQGWRWRPGAVAVSVGAMNLVGCWFGAMPCCHGSGGLAAQYKFGARTGLAPVLLGGIKVALSLLFGSSLLQLLALFPQPLLGALLLCSGLELAAAARKETDARGYCFMLLTAAAIMGLRNTAVGFAVGVGGCGLAAGHAWALRWWERRSRKQRYVAVPSRDQAEQEAEGTV